MLVLAPAFLLASRHPPPDRVFSGAFAFGDDVDQYLSFVEQASRGVVLFENKFDVRPHDGFLLNPSWWAGGVTARLLGGRTVAGLHVFGALALFLLLGGAARLLALAGADEARRAWGLALFALGGGGGWIGTLLNPPGPPAADVALCLYPFRQMTVAPHGVVGVALLLWSAAHYIRWRHGMGTRWWWICTAALLALARPFDAVLFGALVVWLEARAARRGQVAAWRRLAEAAWLLPVGVYLGLAYAFHSSFGLWSRQNVVPVPGLASFAWGLGPALAIVAFGSARLRGAPASSRDAVNALFIIALVPLLLLPLPITFSLQLMNATGGALLLLTALALPLRGLPVATAALCPTSLVILFGLYNPPPPVFMPADYELAARHLAGTCQPGDVVYAPIDPSLAVAGRTPCSVAIGHRVLTPDFAERARETETFYASATPAVWRESLLRALHVRFVMLPPGPGEWLGPEWRPILRLRSLVVWQRLPQPP